jgi:hypothetical protein
VNKIFQGDDMEGQLHLNGNDLEIVGASKIVSSTQNQAVVETDGSVIIVSGSDIEVKKLNLEEGIIAFYGKFSNIKFNSAVAKKQPFLKRIFK